MNVFRVDATSYSDLCEMLDCLADNYTYDGGWQTWFIGRFVITSHVRETVGPRVFVVNDTRPL